MKQSSIGTTIMVIIWAWVIILFAVGCINKCAAQDKTALRLVQCIRAECDDRDNPEEMAAMAWALFGLSVDRGVPFEKQIMDYCAYANRHNPRARAIWASTFDKPVHGSRKWWARMKVWAQDFLDGKIPDPLDEYGVLYFGGEMDPRRGSCKEMKRYCDKRGKRCNIFYRCGQ